VIQEWRRDEGSTAWASDSYYYVDRWLCAPFPPETRSERAGCRNELCLSGSRITAIAGLSACVARPDFSSGPDMAVH